VEACYSQANRVGCINQAALGIIVVCVTSIPYSQSPNVEMSKTSRKCSAKNEKEYAVLGLIIISVTPTSNISLCLY